VEPEVDSQEDESPGLWTSFGIALRLIVGWFCVAIGTLNLLVEMDRHGGQPDTAYLMFHAMLVVGGAALLAVGPLGRGPGPVGYTAGGVVATAGMLVSAIPVTNTVCCMSAFAVRHGYPFTFLARNEGRVGRWHIDSQHLLADLLFWGYAGLLVLVVVALFRQGTTADPDEQVTTTEPDAQPTTAEPGDVQEPGRMYTHAEPRAPEQVREQHPADD
jgi:hypothetical protein